MGLPWVRLDADIATHDKILELVNQPGGHRAAAVYMFALGWSGGHGTDGHIPRHALPMIHARPTDARLLQQVGLWELNGTGWHIHNYATRQELSAVTELKRAAQREAARRTNCMRRHPPGRDCWTREPP